MNIVPGLVAFSGEYAHLVASGPSAEILRIPPGRAFDQDLEHLADIPAVALEAQVVLKGDYLVQSPGLDLGRYVIRIMAGRKGPGPFGVAEHVGVVEPGLPEKGQGGLMVFFGLGTESGYHVGGDAAARKYLADLPDPLHVPFTGVAPSHLLEQAVAAGLDRKMNMLADVVAGRHSLKERVAYVLGVVCRETDPERRVYPGHGGKTDKGCISPHGWFEKDANLMLAEAVREELVKLGYRVVLTRRNDREIKIYDRPKAIYAVGGDAFISIHHNSPPANRDAAVLRYAAVYSWNPLGEAMARAIAKRMDGVQRSEMKSNGAMHANFAVTRNPEIPSCLIEADFITHPAGEEAAWDPVRRQKLAEAIAAGFSDWHKGVPE